MSAELECQDCLKDYIAYCPRERGTRGGMITYHSKSELLGWWVVVRNFSADNTCCNYTGMITNKLINEDLYSLKDLKSFIKTTNIPSVLLYGNSEQYT